MCVAIYKPKDILLSKRTLKKCFKANQDGAGYAFLDENKDAVIRKGFFTFNAFWKDYRDFADKEAIIHFRWATHGAENQENCHPFPIPNGALIHNGIISWCEPKPTDPRSDTRVFVEDLLSCFLAQGEDPKDPLFKATLENVIGGSNKMVLFHKGERVILNESGGHWQNGVWFSNLYWQWSGNYYSPYRSTYIYDTDDDWPNEKKKILNLCRSESRDLKLRQRLIDNGSDVKVVDNVLGFDVSNRTTTGDDVLDEAYVQYLDKQGLWDEESDDEIAEDEDRCDLCDKMIFQGESLITVNGQAMCRACWLNFGDWERDLEKTESDEEYNNKLFARYYRENY